MSEAFSVAEEDRPAVLAGTAEWVRCCPPAQAPGSPEVLAGRIEAALDRADRLMFTVTPREELDAAARWQLMSDLGWCGQLRGVVASTARMSAEERDFAGDELALALGLSSGAGRRLVWQYGAIAALPGLVEAVECGRLTRRHLLACTDQLDAVDLTLEQRQAVALISLARYVDQTPAGWAELVRRVILSIDPQAARGRRDVATDKRRVVFYPQADQQGAIWLQAPVEAVAAAQARVSAEARRLKADGDPRSIEQLQCDVTLDLLTHGVLNGQPVTAWDAQVIMPLSVLEGGDLELAEIPGFGPLLPDTARQLARQAEAFTQIAVDPDGHVIAVSDRQRSDKLRDSSDQGVVAGDSNHDNDTEVGSDNDTEVGSDNDTQVGSDDAEDEAGATGARERPAPSAAMPAGPVTPVGSDDFLTRAVIAMRRPPTVRELTSNGYRPSGRLTRYVQARDRTCVFPGCRQPAMRTDLDHRQPWPRGRTTAQNLQCLCRHHHRAKHSNVFTVLADPDGTIIWITRGGWIFRRRPQGY